MGSWGWEKEKDKGEKDRRKGGELFQSSPYPPSFLQPGCGGGASPLLPSLPHNLEKEEEGILSFPLSPSPLFGFHPCPSLPLLPRSLRTQEEDCQEGSVLFVHSPPLFFALLFLALPPFFHFPGNCAQRRRGRGRGLAREETKDLPKQEVKSCKK